MASCADVVIIGNLIDGQWTIDNGQCTMDNGHVLVLCYKYTVLQFYYVFRLTKQDIILDLNFCFLQGAMKNLQNIRV